MQKLICLTVCLILVSTTLVQAQKGRSFVNPNRSPARKVAQASKATIPSRPQALPQPRPAAPKPIVPAPRPAVPAQRPVAPAPRPAVPAQRPVAPRPQPIPTPISQQREEISQGALAPALRQRPASAAPASVRPAAAAVAAPIRSGGGGGDEGPHPAPEPYSFSFAVNDEESGAQLSREESQDINGNIVGFYHIIDAEGRRRRVDYTAGPDGFKATINSNEEGLLNAQNSADADFVVEEVPEERQNAAAAAAQAAARQRQGAPRYRS